MKKLLPLLLVLVLFLPVTVFPVPDGESRLFRGTVVDRAMDDGLAYIGPQCDDGSGICVYIKEDNLIPEGLTIGDRIEVTCRVVSAEHGERYIASRITNTK